MTLTSRALVWLAGVAAGLAAVGLPTGNDFLVNLDLIALGALDTPESLLAMGPDISRVAPLRAILSLASPPLAAATIMRLWMIGIVAVAWVGVVRLLDPLRWSVRAGAATLFALSPFLLTRLAVGHLGFATAIALLPWAAPALLKPTDGDPHLSNRVLYWLAAFALTGYFGVLIAGPTLFIGLLSTRARVRPTQVAIAILTQIPWLLPALFSARAGSAAAGSTAFATDVQSVGDAAHLLVGFGFWRPSNQLGNQGLMALGLSVALAMFATTAVMRRSSGFGPMLALGAFGYALAIMSALPGVSDQFDAVTRFVAFAPFRESQRLAVLAVFAVLFLAAYGLDAWLPNSRRTDASIGFATVLITVVVCGSSLWGLNGAATGHPTPYGWDDVASEIADDPGPVMALPWQQYFTVRTAALTLGHHPVPALVRGDVLYSHDLRLESSGAIGRDPRERSAQLFADDLERNVVRHDIVNDLGLKWIVAMPDLGLGQQIAALRNAGFEERIALPSMSAFWVDSGPATLAGPRGWGPVSALIAAADTLWVAAVAGLGIRRVYTPS